MVDGILIDEQGRRWPDRSWELMRRFGRFDPKLPLSTFAVRERGFIHIRPQGNGARVALRVGGFELATLAGALYELKERRFPRIILAMLVEEEWLYEMVGGVWEFAERAEHLLAGGPVTVRHPWLAAERDIAALGLPDFALVRPLVELWRSTRGQLPDDIANTIASVGLLDRLILVRQLPRTSRIVFAHLGGGIECVRPGQNLLLLDHDVHDQPDRDYGAWVARAYADCMAATSPRLQSIRATVRLSETALAQGRYDRLSLPWCGPGGERFVTGISLTRNHRCVVDRPRQVG
jgi:hypothetical protein